MAVLQIHQPSLTDAIASIVDDLKGRGQHRSDYGYDITPSKAAYRWGYTQNQFEAEALAVKYGHIFYEAAWELCRRGILRPGVSVYGKQSVDDWGYSLTEEGKVWITSGEEKFVPIDSSSLSRVFTEFRPKFGEGFQQRSQEAIRCRQVEAWLACCTMVGAASESILLSLAIAKTKDEAKILNEYGARDGRRSVTNTLVVTLPKHMSETFKTFMNLLSYWRDEAAHGQASDLNVANADEALRQLLHLGQWADKHWDTLTS